METCHFWKVIYPSCSINSLDSFLLRIVILIYLFYANIHFFFCLSRLISLVMIQRNPSMAESFEDLINIGLLKLHFENLP